MTDDGDGVMSDGFVEFEGFFFRWGWFLDFLGNEGLIFWL